MVSSRGTSVKSEETSYDTRTSSSSSVRSWRRSGDSRVSLIVHSFSASGARYLANHLADCSRWV